MKKLIVVLLVLPLCGCADLLLAAVQAKQQQSQAMADYYRNQQQQPQYQYRPSSNNTPVRASQPGERQLDGACFDKCAETGARFGVCFKQCSR